MAQLNMSNELKAEVFCCPLSDRFMRHVYVCMCVFLCIKGRPTIRLTVASAPLLPYLAAMTHSGF